MKVGGDYIYIHMYFYIKRVSLGSFHCTPLLCPLNFFFAICPHSLFKKGFFLKLGTMKNLLSMQTKLISHSYSSNMHLNLQASWPPKIDWL